MTRSNSTIVLRHELYTTEVTGIQQRSNMAYVRQCGRLGKRWAIFSRIHGENIAVTLCLDNVSCSKRTGAEVKRPELENELPDFLNSEILAKEEGEFVSDYRYETNRRQRQKPARHGCCLRGEEAYEKRMCPQREDGSIFDCHIRTKSLQKHRALHEVAAL